MQVHDVGSFIERSSMSQILRMSTTFQKSITSRATTPTTTKKKTWILPPQFGIIIYTPVNFSQTDPRSSRESGFCPDGKPSPNHAAHLLIRFVGGIYLDMVLLGWLRIKFGCRSVSRYYCTSNGSTLGSKS